MSGNEGPGNEEMTEAPAAAGTNLGGAHAILGNLGGVSIVEQDKVRQFCCMCINKGEKQFNVMNPNGDAVMTFVEDKDNFCRDCGCCIQSDFLLHIREHSEDADDLAQVLVNRRYCSWLGCMQCCRPKLTLRDHNKQTIGSVGTDFKLPCDCTPQFSVRDRAEKIIFYLEEELHCCANIICCGAHSRYCLGIKCYIPSTLYINDKRSNIKTRLEHMDSGRSVDADAYHLDFPEGISADDKLLLITATVLVDYSMFSAAPKKSQMVELEDRIA